MARFRKNEIISLVAETPRFDLGSSVGPDLRVSDLLDASGQRQLGNLTLHYGTHDGDARLRELVAGMHGVAPQDVIITVGGQQALFLLAFVLCDPGDEAVITSPLYPPTQSMLEAVGARLRMLPLAFDSGYRIDLDALRSLLSPGTRLVALASPQNPSGVAVPRDTIRRIVEMMADACPRAYLLVDETYREAVYGDDRIAPSCIDLGPNVISLASLSKCHGAPGLRAGWVITRHAELREQLILGKFNTVVSCSPVDEFLAVKLLEQRDRILGERRRSLADGLARTASWMSANRPWVEWVRPDAGAICCVRLNPAVFDEAAVRRFHDISAAEGVRVAHGTWFGEDARVFRLGFGRLPGAELDAALARLAAVLQAAVRTAA